VSRIESYLAALERELDARGPLRRRILTEVEDHLRESARERGEDEAVRRFGPPVEVARRFRLRVALSSLRGAAAVLAAAVVSVPLLYPIPENVLPPAPWPEGQMPGHLEWKQDAIIALLLVASAAAAAALAALRRPLVLAVAAVSAFAAVGAMTALAVMLGFEWMAAVPGTPSWLMLLPFGQLALVALAGGLLVHAALVRRAASLD
jgi:hypothetical protein